MEIKAVCFDIDNTLYDHSIHAFTPSSLEAIELLKAKGIKIFAITSRALDSVEFLGLSEIVKPDAIASYNGAVITTKEGTYAPRLLPKEEVEKGIELARRLKICLQVITIDGGFLVTPETEFFEDYMLRLHEKKVDYKDYENDPCTGLLFYSEKKYDNEIKKLNGFMNRFDKYGVEITLQENLKSDGVITLEKMYNIPKENMMCFGDDIFDLSMFKVCGYSVAMGNAKDCVKEIASEVTENISENGVYNCLKRHGLI